LIRMKNTYREKYRHDNAWKGKLIFLMSDCLQVDANSLQYEEKDLVAAVVKYNKCSNSDYVETKTSNPFSRITLGGTTGIRVSRLEINREGPLTAILAPNYNSTDPFYGMLVNIQFPRLNKKISVGTGLQYHRSSFSGVVEIEEFEPGINILSETYINLTSWTIPLTINFTKEFQRSELVFEVGVAYEYFSKKEAIYKLDMIDGGGSIFQFRGDAISLRGSVENFSTGVTYFQKYEKVKLGLNLSYQRSTEINGEADFSVPNNKFSVGLIVIKK
ncbi:MAG: hypothetical protein WBA74_27600, partial [Cyclobacteriaceae bacterium]